MRVTMTLPEYNDLVARAGGERVNKSSLKIELTYDERRFIEYMTQEVNCKECVIRSECKGERKSVGDEKFLCLDLKYKMLKKDRVTLL